MSTGLDRGPSLDREGITGGRLHRNLSRAAFYEEAARCDSRVVWGFRPSPAAETASRFAGDVTLPGEAGRLA